MPIPKKEDLQKVEPTEPVEPTMSAESVTMDNHRLDVQTYQTKRMRMFRHLEAQPTVRCSVPLEGKENPGKVEVTLDKSGIKKYRHISGAVLPVNLNGYKILIPKGVYVEVPEQVFEIIQSSQKETQEAGAMWRIDKDEFPKVEIH